MKPNRSAVVCGHLVEEFNKQGNSVVYLNYKKFNGTYDQAMRQAQSNPIKYED